MAVLRTVSPWAIGGAGLQKRCVVRELSADVIVVGGGTGGFAAALAAARMGKKAIVTKETDWIGVLLVGQVTELLDQVPGGVVILGGGGEVLLAGWVVHALEVLLNVYRVEVHAVLLPGLGWSKGLPGPSSRSSPPCSKM
jgi:FAD dependent oxidoreductase